jgi:transcriptional regulator with XRE-family HTH domain
VGYDVAHIRAFLREGKIKGAKTGRGDWRIAEEEVARIANELAEVGSIRNARLRLLKPIARRSHPDVLPELLGALMERHGMSQHDLAQRVGINPSYVAHIRAGKRSPSATMVHAMARALGVSDLEENRLLVAAGHAPRQVVLMGGWDEALECVATVLGDSDLSPHERARFRAEVIQAAKRWRRRA